MHAAAFPEYALSMGHCITALVGSRRALAKLSTSFGSPEPTELTATLLILPLNEERLDALSMTTEDSFQGFTYLKPAMAAEIGRALDGERALYIETDYFGGMGGQCAAFFENDALNWRDAESSFDEAHKRSLLSRFFRPHTKRSKSPISQGLAMLGVVPTSNKDEFDAVGLQRFRSLEALGIGYED